MADEEHDTIDKTETAAVKPRRTALSTPLLGIVLGIVGTVLMAYGFVNGISAALDGTDGNSGLFIGLFIGGGVLAAIAILIGLVGLVRGGHRILSFLSLVIGLVPAVVILLIRLANA
ncbi:MAG: hypothetical protein ABI566_08775 [Pseudolysinimonas sp.]